LTDSYILYLVYRNTTGMWHLNVKTFVHLRAINQSFKKNLAPSYLSVRTVRGDSYWTNITSILFLAFLLKYAQHFRFWLISGKNNSYCTWKPTYTFTTRHYRFYASDRLCCL